MTAALPNPNSDGSFGRALALWRSDQRRDAPFPEAGDRLAAPAAERSLMAYAPYAVALALALAAGAAAASLATAPVLNDSLETITAVDARTMGLAANLDPTGQQTKAASINREVASLKTEITRLQRALEQSRTNQSAQSKAVANQAASSQEEVKALKSEITKLHATLESTRDAAVSKIDSLSAKVEQSKDDTIRLTEVRERLDRMERLASVDKVAPAARDGDRRADVGPETTGSIGQAPRGDGPRAQGGDAREVASRDPGPGPVVRGWVVREVVRGVALLEGREGMIEVVRGARVPKIGRIRSIERRDGQWVVVTDRGVVLERSDL